VGECVGIADGRAVGEFVGDMVGISDGAAVGLKVGAIVGGAVQSPHSCGHWLCCCNVLQCSTPSRSWLLQLGVSSWPKHCSVSDGLVGAADGHGVGVTSHTCVVNSITPADRFPKLLTAYTLADSLKAMRSSSARIRVISVDPTTPTANDRLTFRVCINDRAAAVGSNPVFASPSVSTSIRRGTPAESGRIPDEVVKTVSRRKSRASDVRVPPRS
jgi:hypothetical protein